MRFRREHKDFSVADPSGPLILYDFANNVIYTHVFDPSRDLHFGKESQLVLIFSVLVEVTFLATHALDFTNFNGFQGSPAEAIQNGFSQVGFYDGDDLFHG